MSEVIMGLDQSFTSTGAFIFVKGQPKTFNLFGTTKDGEDPLTMFKRAKEISTQVSDFAEGYGVTTCIIEGLGFGAKGDQTRNLGGLQYMIVNELLNRSIKVDIVAPTSLKKFSTGSGKAKKEELFEAIMSTHMDMYMLFSDIPKTKGRYDLVDAYWLGMWGLAKECEEEPVE